MSSPISNLVICGIASLTLWGVTSVPVMAQADSQPTAAEAEPQPVAPPTEITSDSMEYDMKNQRAYLVGNVRVRDRDMSLKADQMTLFFSEDSQIQSIEATGDVHIVRGLEQATSGKATYDVVSGLITLTGKPVLYRGPNRIRNAETISFDRQGGKAKAVPPEGTQLIFEFYQESDEDIKGLEALSGNGANSAATTP